MQKKTRLNLSKKRKPPRGSSPAPKSSKPDPSAPPPEPYPDHPLPTPEQCRAVRDDLLAVHGFPAEFVKYRTIRRRRNATEGTVLSKPEPSSDDHSTEKEEEEETVLDGLVSTLLSQNTTESNSRRAFESLKSAFPTWEEVLAAESGSLENAIRCGGLATTKATRIRSILKAVMEKRGEMCLEYLRGMPVDAVKAELSHFKGIGPKTVACVLMFHLQKDDFPVDTHVFRITKAIGWVPMKADREKAYLHLNRRTPDELKFDLNCLLVTHGKVCLSCAKKGGNQLTRASSLSSCPLTRHFSNTRSTGN